MADCSYSRCVQERRNIRRELQKWTKNMVYIVGLERIAEELMGRRKWKLYQECMSRNQQQPSTQVHSHPHPITNNNINNNNNNNNNCIIDSDSKVSSTTTQATQTTATTTTTTTTTTITTVKQEPENDEQERLKDWSPQSKCYFCVDGKLDSDHTTHGALSPRPSDSESSDSPSDSEVSPTLLNKSKQQQQYQLQHQHQQQQQQHQQQLQSLGRHRGGGMTTIESVTSMASLAAVAALTGGTAVGSPGTAQVPFAYQPLFASAPWYLNSLARNLHQHHQQQQQQQQQQQHQQHQQHQQQQQQQQQHGGERSMDVDKVGGEQPLDLSSKPGNSTTSTSTTPNSHSAATTPTPIIDNKIPPNIRLAGLDTKHIFKAKPRMSAVGGRRTYTEEELQAALRDIQSGKLGTRRAAVIYGIPRSTLRNKVYKLAMERERETHLVPPGPLGALVAEDDAMDDDKELSGAEEEKEVEKALQAPLLSMADFVRFSSIAESPDALRALLLQQHQLRSKQEGAGDMWAGMEHSALGPYIQLMMANQLAGGGGGSCGGGGLKDTADFMLPEIMRKIIAEEQHIINNGEANEHAIATAKPTCGSHPSPSNSIKIERLKTDSMSDMDTDDSPSNVILKIPSFKPTTSKNGGDMYRVGETGALASSPPLTSESGSPPIVTAGNMLSIREAIAKSISQKFQQSPEPLKMHADIDYKRVGLTPPLAIIKNHQVPSEPPTPPASVPTIPQPPTIVHTRNYQSAASTGATPSSNNNHHNTLAKQTTNNNNNNNSSSNNNNNSNSNSNSNSAGGKGTRPKRGKYRNYDRDSLVEAVRAVQRGEMSVHRAGSYYGVPHSTLEYKVKERHLMRPRKRDPKPNPVDEKIAAIKSQEIRNIPEKILKPVMKPQQKFAPTSPNGLKMPPMFDPAMTPMGYNPPPFPFWPHPSFPHLPLDYPRNPSTSQFPPNPEFFASQMMQRLQEQSARCHPDATSSGGTAAAAAATATATAGLTSANGNTSTTNSNSTVAAAAATVSATATPPVALAKIAESLYDGTGANGSFLDGIIRSSLESGVPPAASGDKEDTKNVAPENMSNKALLDQLCRNSRITPLPKANSVNTDANSSGDESYRKGASPLNFATKSREHHQDDRKCRDRDDIQTIELSNDSNDSTSAKDDDDDDDDDDGGGGGGGLDPSPTQQSPPSRIYVKPQFQEITKPENLKPEVLVRFRATADECDDSESIMIERNGIIMADAVTGSASDKPDMAQD